MAEPVLVWLHGDSLSPEDPAVRRHPGAPRVFVFDRPLLEQTQFSFKRLFFLYECAGGAGAEIRVGDPVEELIDACRSRGIGRIVVTPSISPRFHDCAARLRREVTVELVPEEPFIEVPPGYEARRFSAFWRRFGDQVTEARIL